MAPRRRWTPRSARPAASTAGPGPTQYEWLAADLAAHPAACTLAYWHHPRWDWLKYQKADWTQDYELLRTKPLWNLLYREGVDLLLSGHNHNYSRWMPMDRQGRLDPERGIVQFISGAGGRNLNGFGNFHTRPDTFVRGQSDAFGYPRAHAADGRVRLPVRSRPRASRATSTPASGDCH